MPDTNTQPLGFDAKFIHFVLSRHGGWLGVLPHSRLTQSARRYPEIFTVKTFDRAGVTVLSMRFKYDAALVARKIAGRT